MSSCTRLPEFTYKDTAFSACCTLEAYVMVCLWSRQCEGLITWHHVLPVWSACRRVVLEAVRLAEAHSRLGGCLSICWSGQSSYSCSSSWPRWYAALRGGHQSHRRLPGPLLSHLNTPCRSRLRSCLGLAQVRVSAGLAGLPVQRQPHIRQNVHVSVQLKHIAHRRISEFTGLTS